MTGVLLMGANVLLAGNENFLDQLYKAKFGRLSPMTEARLRAEQANSAYREEASPQARIPNTWLEDFWRAKYGRPSPMEEARLTAVRESTAFREEPTPKAVEPANTWKDDFWKAKLGRTFPNQ